MTRRNERHAKRTGKAITGRRFDEARSTSLLTCEQATELVESTSTRALAITDRSDDGLGVACSCLYVARGDPACHTVTFQGRYEGICPSDISYASNPRLALARPAER